MRVFYVPWLHFHQPLVWDNSKLISNVQKMIFSKDSRERWDGKLISRAYKNPAKYIKQLREEGHDAKIMLDFSGILLESLHELSKQGFFDKLEVNGEKIGDIIKIYKEVLKKFPDSIEIAGTPYSHCYFPSTPEDDWRLQIEEWKKVFKKIFGIKALKRVRGFWLPEMGVPGFEDKLLKLISLIKETGFEWIILPLQCLEGYEKLSFEGKIKIACQPHLLRVKDETITTIFRIPTYFIDQQAGCAVEELYKRLIFLGNVFEKISKKPALVVPASDGENGNVMMNEFFPKTFLPFFKEKKDEKICSLLVSDFLDNFYELPPKSEIKIKTFGSSWVGTHKFWTEGIERSKLIERNYKLSKNFHLVEEKLKIKGKKEFENLKKLLLISETSCYLYWGTSFWLEQGMKTMEFLENKISEVKKR
ncbi:MAG: glycoside hydrolase [Candidatus Aenigmatarchaeota archaeon]